MPTRCTIRIPSASFSDETSSPDAPAGGSPGITSSPVVPQGRLVSTATFMYDHATSTATGETEPVAPAALRSRSPEPRTPDALPIAGEIAFAKGEGYSEKVLQHMNKARTTATKSVYNSKWSVFVQYCAKHGADAFKARRADMAAFLTWAFEERKSSPQTLQGYRSAIASCP